MQLVESDLQKTTSKGMWWTGRKIMVRLHLGAYLLQKLYNLTDRKTEYQIKDNAAFQLFSGRGILSNWHVPDHTKIEEFRNRLTPETQRTLGNVLAKTAVTLGFADPGEVDFDSTVQEANISYPSDADLMCKLADMGEKVLEYIKEKIPYVVPEGLNIDMKSIKQNARKYFFLAKNKSIDIRREIFKNLHKVVKQQMRPIIDTCQGMSEEQIGCLPWNIKLACHQLRQDGWRYLLDVAHFIRTHTIKPGKILSFHSKAVKCIKKGKAGKEMEFGRVFQLGRIKGNFLFALASTSLRMNDRKSFIPLLEEHARIFGESMIDTVAVDKGYWSAQNRKKLLEVSGCQEGLQRPGNIKDGHALDLELADRLRNRRSGIEGMIGGTKRGGQLGRSRMKSDRATLSAGYGSILGMNLRQLIRCKQQEISKAA